MVQTIQITVINQNYIHKEIKSILDSGNAFYCSHQNPLCVCSQKIWWLKYTSIMSPVVLYGCKIWSHTTGRRLIEDVSEYDAKEYIQA